MIALITALIWLSRFNEKHPIDEYKYFKKTIKSCKENMRVFHNKCGRYFSITPNKHWKGQGCNLKGCKYNSYTNKQVLVIFRDIHGDTYIYKDIYRNMNDKNYTITCKIHGNFKCSPSRHKQGQGCPKCGIIKMSNSLRHSLKQVINDLKKCDIYNEYDLSLITKYKKDIPVMFIHKKCETMFSMTVGNFKQGHRCSNCKSSKGENLILNHLVNDLDLKQHTDFFTQFKFLKCKNIKSLPFDFYVSKKSVNDNVLLIEYDGIQHYEIVDFFGGIDKFIERANNDKKKNQFAKKYKIHLIRVPYWIKTQKKINEFIEKKFRNTTRKELDDHNEKREKDQQLKIDEYYKKEKELVDGELKDIIHKLKPCSWINNKSFKKLINKLY